MKALILAAGRGERMRPLTDATPKPLLPVRGKPLIEWHLEALARAGVREVVINTAWLEQQFRPALGDGARWGLSIRYSSEGRDHGGALETAGGIAKALPWLTGHDDDAFWLVSADIFAPGFAFDAATAARFAQQRDLLAHLWLVPNPPFHPQGDFGLDAQGYALADPPDLADPAATAAGAGRRWTYANFALLRAGLCRHIAVGTVAKLGPLLAAAMHERRITAELYRGEWHNLGTPQQWRALQAA